MLMCYKGQMKTWNDIISFVQSQTKINSPKCMKLKKTRKNFSPLSLVPCPLQHVVNCINCEDNMTS